MTMFIMLVLYCPDSCVLLLNVVSHVICELIYSEKGLVKPCSQFEVSLDDIQ